MSWHNVKRLNEQTGRRFVAASVEANGRYAIAIDTDGNVFDVVRESGQLTPRDYDTTTSSLIKRGDFTGEWGQEIQRRIESLS